MFDSTGAAHLMKDGARHYSGLEEAMFRNIEACKGLAKMTRSALGPHGMNKMVINYLEKLFVTSDAATIIRETDIHHPAAKMIAQAAKMQENECGDGTNLLITFAGELLTEAENLMKMGLHPSEILIGYEKAANEVYKAFESFAVWSPEDLRNKEQLTRCIKGVVASKQYGLEDLLSGLIAEASIHAMPEATHKFNLDNIRVQKILGGGLPESEVIHGMVITRGSETTIRGATKAKVAVFNTNIEMQQGETKGTVLLKNADDLLNYTRGEEDAFEAFIKGLAEAGV